MESTSPRGNKRGVDEVRADKDTNTTERAPAEGEPSTSTTAGPSVSKTANNISSSGSGSSNGSNERDERAEEEEEGDAVARKGDLEMCKRNEVRDDVLQSFL